nr:hypothetical protein [Tanacetum cinerariifolium]
MGVWNKGCDFFSLLLNEIVGIRRSGRFKCKGPVIEENSIDEAIDVDEYLSDEEGSENSGEMQGDKTTDSASTSGKKQNTQLGHLRNKYAAKLLLSDCSIYKGKIREEMDGKVSENRVYDVILMHVIVRICYKPRSMVLGFEMEFSSSSRSPCRPWVIPHGKSHPALSSLSRCIHYVKDADSDICEEIELSDGTFNYKPIVDESEKPKIRSEYSTIDKCIEMYAKYAKNTSIGATRAHHLYASTHGGYESVNATATEKLHVDKFSFEYIVKNSQLSALFWADEMSKYNYKEFGDTISFDATFRTNKKCVTFGAGMLSNETTKSYKWLLTCFLKAFNKQPRLVVTDQDPAMRNAIAFVFNESTHMLCMWHITNKLPLKICSKVLDNGTFKRRLHHLISESIENGIETVTIKEIREIKVSTDKSNGSVLCSCMNFMRFGFLCRHIFCVLKGNGLDVIPDKYILKRWMGDLLPPHIRRKKHMFGFEGGRYMECSATFYSAVEYCLNHLEKDEEKFLEFVKNVKRMKTEVEEANPNAKQLSKKRCLTSFSG